MANLDNLGWECTQITNLLDSLVYECPLVAYLESVGSGVPPGNQFIQIILGAPIVPSLERLTQERHLVANLDRVVWEHPLVAK